MYVLKISFPSVKPNMPTLRSGNAAACDLYVTEYNSADTTEVEDREKSVN